MPDPNSPFTSMIITFYTGNQEKDHDTLLEVMIFTNDGDPAIAYINDSSNPNDLPGRPKVVDDPLPDGFIKSYLVPPTRGGFLYQDATRKNLNISITPVGNNTWRFQFSAVLNFADGSILTLNKTGDQTLDQDARRLLYPLGGLTAATEK